MPTVNPKGTYPQSPSPSEEIADKAAALTSALTVAAKAITESAESFARRPPAQRGTWLGYLLIIGTFAGEVAQAAFSAFGVAFDFSDRSSTIMLIVGALLIVAAGVLETYYTIKVADSLQAQAAEMESKAAELRQEASGLKKWLLGM